MNETRPQSMEPLEPRTLLSSIRLTDKNLLQIVGTQSAANTISIGYSPHKRFIVVVLNGTSHDYNPTDVDDIRVFGGLRSDTISVVESRAEFDKSIRAVLSTGDDTFSGGHENDVVFGDDGDDVISLGLGDDAAVGGNGNDTITADNDSKLIFGGAGDDTITVGNGRGYLFGDSGNDTITTNGDRWEILGNTGDDTLTGHGRDTIWGGDGVDVIHGGTETHAGEVSGVGRIEKQLLPVEPTLPKIN